MQEPAVPLRQDGVQPIRVSASDRLTDYIGDKPPQRFLAGPVKTLPTETGYYSPDPVFALKVMARVHIAYNCLET